VSSDYSYHIFWITNGVYSKNNFTIICFFTAYPVAQTDPDWETSGQAGTSRRRTAHKMLYVAAQRVYDSLSMTLRVEDP